MSGPLLFLLTAIVITIVVLVIYVDWDEAERLNLDVEICGWVTLPGRIDNPALQGGFMAKIGDKFKASIAPTNIAGAPAPVTDVEFSVTAGYTIEFTPGDLFATLTASVPGGTNSVQ